MVRDRHLGIERLAQVRGNRENKKTVCTGGAELAGLANCRVGGRAGDSGDDRDVGGVAHDFQDADFLVVAEGRPLAGVDVDRQRDRSLIDDPADVIAQRHFVDAAVGMHRQDGG